MNRMFWLLLLLRCGALTPPGATNEEADSAATIAGPVVQDHTDTHGNTPCDVAAVAADIALPQPVCMTDNPCMRAFFDSWKNECVFRVVDQIGDVFCDDFNPCTYDDICVGPLCKGVVDHACVHKKGWDHP